MMKMLSSRFVHAQVVEQVIWSHFSMLPLRGFFVGIHMVY